MSSGPFIRFNPPTETRTVCAFGALTRNIARPSGKMQGYLASGIFNGLGLQSFAACPQHNAQLRAARINGNLMKPRYREAAGGDAGRAVVSGKFGIRMNQIRSRYTISANSLSKEF
jgi:hypothetical protein